MAFRYENLRSVSCIVVKRARACRVSSGRAWMSKNCRPSIGPDAVAKSRFSVSDRAFVITGIKQREHLI